MEEDEILDRSGADRYSLLAYKLLALGRTW